MKARINDEDVFEKELDYKVERNGI
jgi:hypothetical protein